MEIVYRAMTGTTLEKIFTSEEECKRYEYLNSIKMWDWVGERTDDFSHAMVLFLPPRCDQLLRERWGDETIFDPESPFRRVLLEDLLMRKVILLVLPDFIFMIQTIINSSLVGSFFLQQCVSSLIKIQKKLMKWRLINKYYIIIEN